MVVGAPRTLPARTERVSIMKDFMMKLGIFDEDRETKVATE